MFFELAIVSVVALFLGAWFGSTLSSKHKRNITIALVSGLLNTQKGLYFIVALEDLQKRLNALDEKAAPDQVELLEGLRSNTEYLKQLIDHR